MLLLMRLFPHVPKWLYELSLLAAALIWGGSFVVLKDAMGTIPPGWLLGIRFLVSGFLLMLIFWKRFAASLDGSHLLAGLVIGLPQGVGYLIRNIGLTTISPGRNAFLTDVYCVVVPFLNWMVIRKRPGVNHVVAAIMVLAGVGLLSLDFSAGSQDLSLSLSTGDILTLVSALMFSVNIVFVGYLGRAHDIVVLTVLMLYVSALVCLGYAAVAEPLPSPEAINGSFLPQMAYLVLLATVYTSLAQNVGQKHVEAPTAALLLSLESVFAVIFSIVFYGETLNAQLLVGFALIFAAILVSELAGARPKAKVAVAGDTENPSGEARVQ